MTLRDPEAELAAMREPRPCKQCGVLCEWGYCENCTRAFAAKEARSEIDRGSFELRRRLEPYDVKVGSRALRERTRHASLRPLAAKYDPSRGNVFIMGPSGIGKTTTLRAIAWRLLDEARIAADVDAKVVHAHYTTGLRLARSKRETPWGTSDDEFDSACRAPLLFLDEIGAEDLPSSWLLEVAEARHGRLPTLVASGFPKAQLLGRYGVSAMRKLVEPGGIELDLFGGKDKD